MPAAKKNLTIEQGATFEKRLTWRDRTRRAVNLAGFGALMQIRDQTGALVCDLSSNYTAADTTPGSKKGTIVLGNSAGTIDLMIPDSETSTMSFVTAQYDLLIVYPNGSKKRLIEGRVFLSAGQTRVQPA